MNGESDVVGSVGFLTVGTRGSVGPGEVTIKVRGGTESYLAWSDEPLPRGTSVLIVESRGGRALGVVGWADPPGTPPTD